MYLYICVFLKESLIVTINGCDDLRRVLKGINLL